MDINNYDELLDCIFHFGQAVNETGPFSVTVEDINIDKEYVPLIKSGFTHLLNGTQVKNIVWRSEIIYYIMNHPNITQHEIQEILLMEEIIVLFQNGSIEKLPEILQRYGSYDLVTKYSKWLESFIQSKNI